MPPPAMEIRPKPRACVIGTSNSAGAGSYAGALARDPWFQSVENRALGFCTSDLFSFRKPGLDFAAFDLCILDFAPNEGALLTGRRLDRERVLEGLTGAVSEISRAGCLPILTILPIVNLMPDGRAIRQLYTKIAERHGLPFFDGYAFLNRLLAVDPEAPAPGLFKDRMHFTNEVARFIGEELGDALRQLWAMPIDFDAPLTMTKGHDYRFLPAGTLFEGYPTLHRETAMVEAKFVHVTGETRLRTRIPAGWELTSLVADYARCRGVLSISDAGTGAGTGAATTCLGITSRNYTEDPAVKMTLGIFPLPAPVGAADGEIELTLSADGPAAFSVGIPASAGDSPGLMIAGFVARGPRGPIPMRRMLPEAVELGALIPDARLRAARARLAPPADFVATGKIGYE
ncbi:SGNH/GDSL hydrolase family protein [Falsiroseomonas sp.]|uniref:SGNH/GDSL hydrolase family protein n=1 Tax=Falsiroseomonas sp. TaxID=2870721 RepID=UPI003F70DA8D